MNVDQAESRVITEQPTAVRRATLAPPELPAWFDQAYADIASYLSAHGIKHQGPPFARYHVRPDGRFDVEAGFPVAAPIAGTVTVRPSKLPGGAVVSLWHIGPYDRVGQTYAEIAAWIREVGASSAGDAWEIYHEPPADDPMQRRTEVVQPYTFPEAHEGADSTLR
ncbi:GyrI-like domain-containing protein [Kribbella sp. NPDC020789]